MVTHISGLSIESGRNINLSRDQRLRTNCNMNKIKTNITLNWYALTMYHCGQNTSNHSINGQNLIK